MTKEEYLEYWKSMSHDELMVRAGLYIDRIAELEGQVIQLQAGVSEMENNAEWPPASTAIVSEYEAALRPDDMPSFPTCEQMVTALRTQDYIVLTNVEIDTLHYVGGECPVCGQKVSP